MFLSILIVLFINLLGTGHQTSLIITVESHGVAKKTVYISEITVQSGMTCPVKSLCTGSVRENHNIAKC